MVPMNDWTNVVIGNWRILHLADSYIDCEGKKRLQWKALCLCCGEGTKIFKSTRIPKHLPKSCGCVPRQYHRTNLIGNQYNFLTVIADAPSLRHNGEVIRRVLVRCVCGNEYIIRCNGLRDTKSCGCMAGALIRDACRQKQGGKLKSEMGLRRDYPPRNTIEYRRWKKKIAPKGTPCALCGRTSKVEAHHINPYAIYPDDQTRDVNGVALCKSCHRAYHGSYKQVEINRESLTEYINRVLSTKLERSTNFMLHVCNHCEITSLEEPAEGVDGYFLFCHKCNRPLAYWRYDGDTEKEKEEWAEVFAKFWMQPSPEVEISVHTANKLIAQLTEQITKLNEMRMNLQFRVAESGVK